MTSTVPGEIAWPGIVFTLLVVVLRWHWFRSNSFDIFFNNALTLLLLAEVFREPVVQKALSRNTFVTTAWSAQLSAILLGFAATEFIGFAGLWQGLSDTETRTRQRRYRWLAAGCSASFLAFGKRTRDAGQPLEIPGGWDRVAAWTVSVIMLLVLAVLLLRRAYVSFGTVARTRERLVVAGVLALGLAIVVACVQEIALQVTDELGWTDTTRYRMQVHGRGVLAMITAVALLGAVPCMSRLIAGLGLDARTKSWRTLQLMRYDLRNAVPDAAFDVEFSELLRTPYMRLHHTVVEIRDAMLQLRQFPVEIPAEHLERFLVEAGAAPLEHANAIQAVYLAQAARNRIGCATPASADPGLIAIPTAMTLEDEASDLMKLAAWWPIACAAVADPVSVINKTTTGRPRF